ncbi:hypothetical protein C806_01821 [Lachnospiraceae bacterium 3-1]|nr:hypothetical protein C806_01821 [Lachnospiraceae bacterium 3-1]
MKIEKLRKIKKDTVKYKMFAFLLSWGMLQKIVSLSAQILGVYNLSWFTMFSRMVLLILLAFIGYELLESPTSRNVVVICIIWLSLFGISLFRYGKEMQGYISDLGGLLVLSFLSIIIIFSKIEDFGRLERELRIYIYFMAVYSLLNICYNKIYGGYSMDFSYHAVLSAILSLLFAVVYGKRVYYFYFALYCVSNLWAGSRGSFLCIVISAILIVFLYGKKTNVKLATMLGVSVGGFAFLFKNVIIDFLSEWMGNSRTLDLLKNGQLFNMSGRDSFYYHIKDTMFDNIFSIKGFYADRLYLCNAFKKPFSPGTYAHNIVYEIVYDFGGLGIIFLFFMLYFTIKCYMVVKRVDDKALKNLYIISVSYAFGQLFISSSYLIAPSFGILVASYMHITNYNKHNFRITICDEELKNV